jgi:hypothetical protein
MTRRAKSKEKNYQVAKPRLDSRAKSTPVGAGRCLGCFQDFPALVRVETNLGLIYLCGRCLNKARSRAQKFQAQGVKSPRKPTGGKMISAGAVDSNRNKH